MFEFLKTFLEHVASQVYKPLGNLQSLLLAEFSLQLNFLQRVIWFAQSFPTMCYLIRAQLSSKVEYLVVQLSLDSAQFEKSTLVSFLEMQRIHKILHRQQIAIKFPLLPLFQWPCFSILFHCMCLFHYGRTHSNDLKLINVWLCQSALVQWLSV